MVIWIVVAAVVLGSLILVLSVRALLHRLRALQRQTIRLQFGLVHAQELAKVAEGLQAHSESLKIRAELAQLQIKAIKNARATGARAFDEDL